MRSLGFDLLKGVALFMTFRSNQPFAPADKRSASEIIAMGTEYTAPESDAAAGMNSIRRTLVRSWKNVDLLTRKG